MRVAVRRFVVIAVTGTCIVLLLTLASFVNARHRATAHVAARSSIREPIPTGARFVLLVNGKLSVRWVIRFRDDSDGDWPLDVEVLPRGKIVMSPYL